MSEMDDKWTTFVQWKGTDICMDFRCPKCGCQSHFDGFFAYHIECPECEARFEMPTDLPLKEVEKAADQLTLMTDPD
jgi:uncharacterized protein (DUF983 family)